MPAGGLTRAALGVAGVAGAGRAGGAVFAAAGDSAGAMPGVLAAGAAGAARTAGAAVLEAGGDALTAGVLPAPLAAGGAVGALGAFGALLGAVFAADLADLALGAPAALGAVLVLFDAWADLPAAGAAWPVLAVLDVAAAILEIPPRSRTRTRRCQRRGVYLPGTYLGYAVPQARQKTSLGLGSTTPRPAPE